MVTLRPGDGPGAPIATANPDHQPRVATEAGVPPYCTCGYVGGRGVEIDGRPLLAEHLREHDPYSC
jgi:hypothetical protein